MCSINDLLGLTIKEIKKGDAELIFVIDEYLSFKMYHKRDCCESVIIESITGDMDDIIGSKILKVSESVSREPETAKPDEDGYNSFTWTFYTIATIKGYVDIRWYGSSNGYYSESVDFE
jgi:hypothetical protein